jgi:hypothetical protein
MQSSTKKIKNVITVKVAWLTLKILQKYYRTENKSSKVGGIKLSTQKQVVYTDNEELEKEFKKIIPCTSKIVKSWARWYSGSCL